MSREELEKLTATKLRELAEEYPDIQGAHALKKDELVIAILKARGEPIKVVRKDAIKISDIKKEIRKLKADKQKALSESNAKNAVAVRKQLKKLKRRTRQLASSNKSVPSEG